MISTTLIVGGCRSGKSRQALILGEESAVDRNLFVATCQPHDAEMAARIARHQQERGRHWEAVEAPLDPDKVVVNPGIVPENPMARRFRDLAGWCNQWMALACHSVIWMVAGIAVPTKGNTR